MNKKAEELEQEIQTGDLAHLSKEFRIAANHLERVAAKLEAAKEALQQEREKNRELQRQLDELRGEAVAKADPAAKKQSGKESAVFAVDRAAGVWFPKGKLFRRSLPPL